MRMFLAVLGERFSRWVWAYVGCGNLVWGSKRIEKRQFDYELKLQSFNQVERRVGLRGIHYSFFDIWNNIHRNRRILWIWQAAHKCFRTIQNKLKLKPLKTWWMSRCLTSISMIPLASNKYKLFPFLGSVV